MRREGRRAPLLIGAAAILLAGLFAGLGAWQLERRGWKHALIAQVEARVHAPPVEAPGPKDWPAISAADAYRRVVVSGHFLHEKETLVRATTELGSGYWVLTPLQAPDFTVLVNRGFVPPGGRDPAGRREQDEPAPVRITGLLRLTEPGGGFLRSNVPAEERWYSRDLSAIAAARGLGEIAPYFIDSEARPDRAGYPAGGLTVIRFADNHLIYAMTWFGLAVLSLGWAWVALHHRDHGAGEEA